MDIKWDLCLTSGIMGMDLDEVDSLDDMSVETLKNLQEQLDFWNEMALRKLKEKTK